MSGKVFLETVLILSS